MSKMQRAVRQTARLTAISAALASACGMALAQDAEVAELVTPESSVSIGAGYWTKDRPRLGIYDGMNEEGAYGLLDARIVKRDNATGTWLTLDARNIALDTREFRVDWLRQGDIGAFLEYSRIPRENPYTFLTGVQGIGTSTLRVPTPSATTLNEVHLGTVRDRTGVGFFKSLGGGLGFRVHLQNEDKSGTRQWGRGGAPEFAVEPIDSNTRQLEAILSYASKAFQIQGGYYGSWYTNDIKLVDTALIDGGGVISSQFFLSQPLDNQAHQFFVNGGYNFTQSTRGTFKVAYTRATQDETIPVGAGVPTFAGAPTNLDGQIDTTLLQLGLTSRLSDSFSWLASLRNYESDEKTPQRRIVETNPACLTPSQCVDNTPLTFKTLTGKLEGTYRMRPGLSLLGGIEQVNQDRKVPVGTPTGTVDLQRWVPWRTEVEETTYRLQLRRSLSDTVNGSIAYLHSERDGSEFTLTNEPPHTDFINPIHIADRDRDKVRLMLDWAPTEVLNFTFNVEHSQDDYGYTAARPYGLRDGEATLFSIDAAYSLTDKWQATAWYSRDNTEATQFGFRHASPVEAEKQAHLEDVGDTVGLGLRGVLMPRVKVGGEFLYSKNVNRYPETIVPAAPGDLYPPGVVGPLPDITNKLLRLNLFAMYALQKRSELRFDYVHERWRSDDWSWYFADRTTPFTYGATTDGTQVIDPKRQTADFIGVRYIYRFF
jgi:MtrB/PioB family decaheme-associated outer membrane protein